MKVSRWESEKVGELAQYVRPWHFPTFPLSHFPTCQPSSPAFIR
jgi:hypothetical protein